MKGIVVLFIVVAFFLMFSADKASVDKGHIYTQSIVLLVGAFVASCVLRKE